MKKKKLEKKYTNDLTKKEREMQRIIRKITKEKKKKGKEMKVGYIKMRLVCEDSNEMKSMNAK